MLNLSFRFPAAIILASLTFTSLAYAEPDVACNYGTPEAWAEVNVAIIGSWQIAHHAGYVIAGAMPIPFPSSNDIETMGIEMTADGRMFGTHPEAQAPIEFVWADEPPWSFEADAKADGVPAPLFTSSDVELIMGCEIDDLARLIGHTRVMMDGVQMDMTLRLMVLGATVMYGIFHTSSVVNGIPVNSWRAVTMTR